MAIEPSPIGGQGPSRQTERFNLVGDDLAFMPRFFPTRIEVSKERNLDREENFCKGEDVTDNGAKNREIHIAGKLVGDELGTFDKLLDSSDTFDLVVSTWSGEVRVRDGDYEGPTHYYSQTGNLIWDYRIDLVSTGRDEPGATSGNGVINDAEDVLDLDRSPTLAELDQLRNS